MDFLLLSSSRGFDLIWPPILRQSAYSWPSFIWPPVLPTPHHHLPATSGCQHLPCCHLTATSSILPSCYHLCLHMLITLSVPPFLQPSHHCHLLQSSHPQPSLPATAPHHLYATFCCSSQNYVQSSFLFLFPFYTLSLFERSLHYPFLLSISVIICLFVYCYVLFVIHMCVFSYMQLRSRNLFQPSPIVSESSTHNSHITFIN